MGLSNKLLLPPCLLENTVQVRGLTGLLLTYSSGSAERLGWGLFSLSLMVMMVSLDTVVSGLSLEHCVCVYIISDLHICFNKMHVFWFRIKLNRSQFWTGLLLLQCNLASCRVQDVDLSLLLCLSLGLKNFGLKDVQHRWSLLETVIPEESLVGKCKTVYQSIELRSICVSTQKAKNTFLIIRAILSLSSIVKALLLFSGLRFDMYTHPWSLPWFLLPRLSFVTLPASDTHYVHNIASQANLCLLLPLPFFCPLLS